MNFDELEKDIRKNHNGGSRVVELLQGTPEQFECRFGDYPNDVIILNIPRKLSLHASMFNDRRHMDCVEVKIGTDDPSHRCFDMYTHPKDGSFNYIIDAILRRLPKPMLIEWLMRNLNETSVSLCSDVPTNDCTRLVRTDYRWFIEMGNIILYEMTEAGRTRLQETIVGNDPAFQQECRDKCSPAGVVLVCGTDYTTFVGIVLPLSVADLKPVFVAYHAILDTHRWDDLVTFTEEEQFDNMKRKLRKMNQSEDSDKENDQIPPLR